MAESNTGGAAASSAEATSSDMEVAWARLTDPDAPIPDLESWLAILAAELGAERAALMLGPPNTGPYRRDAIYPDGATMLEAMAAASDLAISERHDIVKSGVARDASGRGGCAVACPVLVEGALRGVVVVLMRVTAELDLRNVIRRLHWALPWVEARLRHDEAERSEATATALELIAAALEEDRFTRAAAASVTGLAERLGCDRVSIGMRRRLNTRIVALSHSGDVSRKAGLMRAIADAMDEAIDQERTILYPGEGEDLLVITYAHAELGRRARERVVLSVPMLVGTKLVGAVTFERAVPFDAGTVRLAEVAVGVLGPILQAKQQNDRPLVFQMAARAGRVAAGLVGPRHLGAKLITLALLALIGWAVLSTAPFRVTADARIEGSVHRVIAAPFEGYLEAAAVKAGDMVAAGDVMARLDDRTIRLELLRWQTVREQRRREYERAFSARNIADSGIVSTQLDQAEAEIALLEERLARTRLRAPFDGIVLAGDLDQSVGAAVERGEVLFEIAPADSYRVTLLVEERDLAEIAPGQTGELFLAALPGETFKVSLGRITAVAVADDGRNVFRVRARLDGEPARLRPGMEGIAKVEVGQRSVAAMWTRELRDWARLTLWRWRP